MQIKKDSAFGVIPIYKEDGEYKVLLIHQISHRGDRFWIFPKGHPEDSESPEATARRELYEETGLTDVELAPDCTFSMSYSFKHDGKLINKTVTYFLGQVKDPATKITQPDEVIELKWCSLYEAMATLSHENSKRILKEVKQYLEERGK